MSASRLRTVRGDGESERGRHAVRAHQRSLRLRGGQDARARASRWTRARALSGRRESVDDVVARLSHETPQHVAQDRFRHGLGQEECRPTESGILATAHRLREEAHVDAVEQFRLQLLQVYIITVSPSSKRFPCPFFKLVRLKFCIDKFVKTKFTFNKLRIIPLFVTFRSFFS